jgi:hypothetical protein
LTLISTSLNLNSDTHIGTLDSPNSRVEPVWTKSFANINSLKEYGFSFWIRNLAHYPTL